MGHFSSTFMRRAGQALLLTAMLVPTSCKERNGNAEVMGNEDGKPTKGGKEKTVSLDMFKFGVGDTQKNQGKTAQFEVQLERSANGDFKIIETNAKGVSEAFSSNAKKNDGYSPLTVTEENGRIKLKYGNRSITIEPNSANTKSGGIYTLNNCNFPGIGSLRKLGGGLDAPSNATFIDPSKPSEVRKFVSALSTIKVEVSASEWNLKANEYIESALKRSADMLAGRSTPAARAETGKGVKVTSDMIGESGVASTFSQYDKLEIKDLNLELDMLRSTLQRSPQMMQKLEISVKSETDKTQKEKFEKQLKEVREEWDIGSAKIEYIEKLIKEKSSPKEK